MLPSAVQQEAKWPSIGAQSTILATILFLASQDKMNSLLLVSLVFVVCLFMLQLSSKRFLFFWPANEHMDWEPTVEKDTYFLYTFTMAAAFFLFLGIGRTYSIDFLVWIDDVLRPKLGLIFVLVLVWVPYFWFWGNAEITVAITQKLMAIGEVEVQGKCPYGCETIVTMRNRVQAWDDLRSIVRCDKCTQGEPREYQWPKSRYIGGRPLKERFRSR